MKYFQRTRHSALTAVLTAVAFAAGQIAPAGACPELSRRTLRGMEMNEQQAGLEQLKTALRPAKTQQEPSDWSDPEYILRLEEGKATIVALGHRDRSEEITARANYGRDHDLAAQLAHDLIFPPTNIADSLIPPGLAPEERAARQAELEKLSWTDLRDRLLNDKQSIRDFLTHHPYFQSFEQEAPDRLDKAVNRLHALRETLQAKEATEELEQGLRNKLLALIQQTYLTHPVPIDPKREARNEQVWGWANDIAEKLLSREAVRRTGKAEKLNDPQAIEQLLNSFDREPGRLRLFPQRSELGVSLYRSDLGQAQEEWQPRTPTFERLRKGLLSHADQLNAAINAMAARQQKEGQDRLPIPPEGTRTLLAQQIVQAFYPEVAAETPSTEPVRLNWKNADAKRVRKQQEETLAMGFSAALAAKTKELQGLGYQVTVLAPTIHGVQAAQILADPNAPGKVTVLAPKQVRGKWLYLPEFSNDPEIAQDVAHMLSGASDRQPFALSQKTLALVKNAEEMTHDKQIGPPLDFAFEKWERTRKEMDEEDSTPAVQVASAQQEQPIQKDRGSRLKTILKVAAVILGAVTVLGVAAVAHAPTTDFHGAGDLGAGSDLGLAQLNDLQSQSIDFDFDTGLLSPDTVQAGEVKLPEIQLPESPVSEPLGLLPEPEQTQPEQALSGQAEPEHAQPSVAKSAPPQTVQSPSKVQSELPPIDRRSLSFSKQKTTVSSGEELTDYFARNVVPPRLPSDKRPAFDFEGPATVEGELQFDRASQEFVYADMKVVAQSPIVITVGEKRWQIPAQTPVELRMHRATTQINGKGVTSVEDVSKAGPLESPLAPLAQRLGPDVPVVELPDVSHVQGRPGPWDAQLSRPGSKALQKEYNQLGDRIRSQYERLTGEADSALQQAQDRVAEALQRFQEAGPDQRGRRWEDLKDALETQLAVRKTTEATAIRFADYWTGWFKTLGDVLKPGERREKYLQQWEKYFKPLEEIRTKATLRLQHLLVLQGMSQDLAKQGVLPIPDGIAAQGVSFVIGPDASLPREKDEDPLVSIRRVVGQERLAQFLEVEIENLGLEVDQLKGRYHREIEQSVWKTLPKQVERKGQLIEWLTDLAEAKLAERQRMLQLVLAVDTPARFGAQQALNEEVILEHQAKVALIKEMVGQPVQRYADKRLNQKAQIDHQKDELELDRINSLGDFLIHQARLGMPLAPFEAEWNPIAQIVNELLGRKDVAQARRSIFAAWDEYDAAKERLDLAQEAFQEAKGKQREAYQAREGQRHMLSKAQEEQSEAGMKFRQAEAALQDQLAGGRSYLTALLFPQLFLPSEQLNAVASSGQSLRGKTEAMKDYYYQRGRVLDTRSDTQHWERQINRSIMLDIRHWGEKGVPQAAEAVGYQHKAVDNALGGISKAADHYQRTAIGHALDNLGSRLSAPFGFNPEPLMPYVMGLDENPSEDTVQRHTEGIEYSEKDRLRRLADQLNLQDEGILSELKQPNPFKPGTPAYERQEVEIRDSDKGMALEEQLAANRAKREQLRAETAMIDAGEDPDSFSLAQAEYHQRQEEELVYRLASTERRMKSLWEGRSGDVLPEVQVKALEDQKRQLRQQIEELRARRAGEKEEPSVLGYVRAVKDGKQELVPLLLQGKRWFDKPEYEGGDRSGRLTPYAQIPEGKQDEGLWIPSDRILEISGQKQASAYVSFNGLWMRYQGPDGYYYVVKSGDGLALTNWPQFAGLLPGEVDDQGLPKQVLAYYTLAELKPVKDPSGQIHLETILVGVMTQTVSTEEMKKLEEKKEKITEAPEGAPPLPLPEPIGMTPKGEPIFGDIYRVGKELPPVLGEVVEGGLLKTYVVGVEEVSVPGKPGKTQEAIRLRLDPGSIRLPFPTKPKAGLEASSKDAAKKVLEALAAHWGLSHPLTQVRIAAISYQVKNRYLAIAGLEGSSISLGPNTWVLFVPAEPQEMVPLITPFTEKSQPVIVQGYGDDSDTSLAAFEKLARFAGLEVAERIQPTEQPFPEFLRQLVANLAGLEKSAIEEEDLRVFEQALEACV